MPVKFANAEVAEIFAAYPAQVRKKLLFLRKLIFATAAQIDGRPALEETLKWGQPSYMVKGGSTVRIDWVKSTPAQYAMYFHCQTKLVDTFKTLYADKFTFSSKRAIVFDLDDEVPLEELTHCISLALTYHKRKHLPLLGC